MKIYTYHYLNGEYLGSKNARKDPLELELNDEVVWLLPANATFINPPDAKENEATVFNTDSQEWDIVADFRGIYFFSDGNPLDIVDLGVKVPVNCTDIAPPAEFKKPFWDGYNWIENYIEPDPDDKPIVITVGIFNQLIEAGDFLEFMDIFKTIGE